MDWNAVGALGEVVGALAVVLTLIYLSVQVRQNSAAIRSATRADIARTQAEANWRISESAELARLFSTYFHGQELAQEEMGTWRCNQFMMGFLRTLENQYFAYLEGNFPESVWEGYRNNIRANVSQHFFGEFWDDRRHLFSREFSTLVDVMREARHLMDHHASATAAGSQSKE